jgi:hypothetical protein
MEESAGTTPPAESRAAKMLREIFESGRPLTYIRSTEEQRVARVLREAGTRLFTSPAVPVWTWSLTEGMRRDGKEAEPGTFAARGALDFIAAHKEPAIFHLKDLHEPLRESPEIRRRLRDLYQTCFNQQKFIVITSPVRAIPEEVERSLIFLELRPPDQTELVEFLREETRLLGGRSEATHLSEPILYQFARALQGLTLDEVRYALRRALAMSPRLGPESVPALLEEKRLLVNRSGQQKNWLGLRLVGGTPIRDIVGTTVAMLRPDGPTLWRRARADGSYGSANDPRVLLGLGNSSKVTKVRAYWVSGRVEEWTDLPLNKYTTLREGTGTVAREK